MALRNAPVSQLVSFAARGRRLRGSVLRTQPEPGHRSETDRAKSSARSALSALLQVQPVSLWILIAALGLCAWLGTAVVLGKLSPEFMVTVQQFEVSPEVASKLSLSGKSASDIVVDILNEVATHASQFHGAGYYKYDVPGTQLVALHQAIKIPVQTSYGIELKGISLDSLIQLYNRRRYQQWIIGGNILSSSRGLSSRIRFNRGDSARSWETMPSSSGNPSILVREATYMMLTSVAPELFGQACLQQEDYELAKKVFRQWEIDEPRNWKPTYYLSLTYGYEKDHEKEASLLADWSSRVAQAQKDSPGDIALPAASSEAPVAANLAKTARVTLETKETAGAEITSPVEARNRLKRLEQTDASLAALAASHPDNVDYRLERAGLLHKEALAQYELDPISTRASDLVQQAIDNLDVVIRKMPANGGLHQQRAIFLQSAETIFHALHQEPKDKRDALMNEELNEYILALQLRPTEAPPLWGAIYAQLSLGRAEDAANLARTITLLQPDSQAASTAYILSAERTPKSLEREIEVETCLKQLIASDAEESKLQAVWYAFKESGNLKGLQELGSYARQRFPKNPTFRVN